jgi:threonine synthase
VPTPAHLWRCPACGSQYPLDAVRYVCRCPAAGRLELRLAGLPAGAAPGDLIETADRSMWRYAALLPVAADGAGARRMRARYRAGWTPLTRARRLAARFGLGELWIKDEGANPSGSAKDRASALVVAAAIELGQRVIATASSGNAGAALAAAARAGGVTCVIFLPARAPGDRVRQLGACGAQVVIVDGDYDAAVRLSLAACDAFGWYCRTTAINPYTAQGKKTAALEIAEQLGWLAPDAVLLPVGDGNILAGLYQGFRDARRLGWLTRLPRLIGVQAAGAPAIYRAWRSGAADATPAGADTIADGIAVGAPLDAARALAALAGTGGMAAVVTDAQIVDAAAVLAADEGIAAEPASAAAVAALGGLTRTGAIGPGDRVVVLNTARGLAARRVAGDAPAPLAVRPDMTALRAVAAALPLARAGREPAAGALSHIPGM